MDLTTSSTWHRLSGHVESCSFQIWQKKDHNGRPVPGNYDWMALTQAPGATEAARADAFISVRGHLSQCGSFIAYFHSGERC